MDKSTRMKKYWKENRDKMMAALHSPEIRKQRSRRLKKQWKDPAFREERMATMRNVKKSDTSNMGGNGRAAMNYSKPRRKPGESHKDYMSRVTKARWRDDSERRKMIKALTGVPKSISKQNGKHTLKDFDREITDVVNRFCENIMDIVQDAVEHELSHR